MQPLLSKNLMAKRLLIHLLAAQLFFLTSTHAWALVDGVVNYVKQYQVGVDYSNSVDTLQLTYDAEAATAPSSKCTVDLDNPSKKKCSASMLAGSSSGFGIFLQRAFKKQGFWYFDYDIGFGARYLSGQLPKEYEDQTDVPLKNAKFSLLTFIGKPYIQFGVTPDRWPDLLISLGPVAQIGTGTMTINDKTENVVVGTSSYSGPMSLWHGFLEIEIVLKRFGEGAFSVFSSRDFSGNGEGTKVYPKSVDGMSNFRGSFSHSVGGMAFGFGLKLVTPWP